MRLGLLRRRGGGAAAVVPVLLLIALAAPAGAAAPRASLTDIENNVMCPSCREPLALAQSPQAMAERKFVRSLIAQGKTKAQIQQALVAQYGPAVLGRPPASGFNLTVYVLPPAVLLAGLAILALLLPRWRRRSQARREDSGLQATPVLTGADARRLEEDLRRFD